MPNANLPLTDALLHALPKSDLHCHLDGSLRLKTMLELAAEQKVKLPADTEEGLGRAMKIGERHGSLEEYFKGAAMIVELLTIAIRLKRSAFTWSLIWFDAKPR